MIINDIIQGQKFINLANNKNIFYFHTHDVNNFLKYSNVQNEFILITHNSDGKITNVLSDEGNDADIKLMPNNLVKWFGQNVDYSHPKIESIPIGLENNKWFPEINKKQVMLDKLNEEKKHRNLLYVNHSTWTYPIDREEPYIIFDNKNWCTLVKGRNGLDYSSYVDNIYNHKFVLSPRGHGIDTHRLWETLYLGSVPIEKRNINNQFYTDLPILFVDDWEEITEDFLNKQYDEIKNRNWNLDKLNFDYWKNKILSL